MVIILKSVKVGLHFFKYLSLGPTKKSSEGSERSLKIQIFLGDHAPKPP